MKSKRLNLIGHVDVRKASTSDTCFLRDGIEKAQEVFPDRRQRMLMALTTAQEIYEPMGYKMMPFHRKKFVFPES